MISQPVLARMTTLIDRWETDWDGRCVFLRCYSMMTANMLQSLDAGRFYDRAWVETLVHRFAEYYFVALDAYDQAGDGVPNVWQRTHDLARGRDTTVMEDLLLGVNAHINYDLALVLRDMLADEWPDLTPSQRNLRYQDHDEVNRVIAETINDVQNELADRYAATLRVLDLVCGPVDEWQTARYITLWRKDVWDFGMRLVEAPDAAARAVVQQELEDTALGRANLIFVGGAVRQRVFGYPVRVLRRLRLL